jgi:hypothetical protein
VRLPYRKFFQTTESSNAVLEMDDQIAFSQFAEIDLDAVTFGTTQPQKPSRMHCESSEQLRSRENDKTCRRKTEAARERSLYKVEIIDSADHDFAEPLDLAFSLKINYDPSIVGAPFFQALNELRTFGLGEHEIAGAKLSNLAILKRAAEIFRTSLNPAFADLDVWSGELLRARRRGSSALHCRLDFDDDVALADVITDGAVLVRHSLIQQNVDRAQIAHGCLPVDVKLAQRFDLIAEKFQSKRQRRMPRIKIDNPAADSELSTSGDL